MSTASTKKKALAKLYGEASGGLDSCGLAALALLRFEDDFPKHAGDFTHHLQAWVAADPEGMVTQDEFVAWGMHVTSVAGGRHGLSELKELEPSVWRHYQLISDAFAYYAAVGTGDAFSVQLDMYSDFEHPSITDLHFTDLWNVKIALDEVDPVVYSEAIEGVRRTHALYAARGDENDG